MSMSQRRIGKYELQQRLGDGAVGETWKAFDGSQRHYVAIKIIPANAQGGEDFSSRFYREGQILTTLQHPNIVPVRDFRLLQDGNEAYIIMDYVEGTSLADYLKTTAHMGNIPSADEIVRLLAPVASALDYAQQRGVIHGALRPAAILLDRSINFPPGEPKLTDFGFNFSRNPLALPPGDIAYISPEAAQGLAITSRSDLYSLGVILYEMCTGALPFSGDTSGDILMQHIHGIPTSPTLINPRISPALTGAIMRSLARDPAARFPTASALVTTVAKALGVSVPESISSRSQPLPTILNPSSQSGISGSLNAVSGPSSPAQWPSEMLPTSPIEWPSPGRSASPTPVPAGDASGTRPALPPPPVVSSSTPVLPLTPTAAPGARMEMNMPTVLTSSSTRIDPAGAAMPMTSRSSFPPQAPAQTEPSPLPARPVRRKRPGWLYVGLVVALLILLLGSAFGIYRFILGGSSAQPVVVGHAFFVSSGLLSSQNSNQGITDEFQINLQNLPAPPAGKSYYAWLLSDQESVQVALGLGVLSPQLTLTYNDPQHNNLLANYNHLLITEESTNPAPTSPSPDTGAWVYSSAFSTTKNPQDTVNHFSLYDHLRHLLSSDPKLAKVGLNGGLDIWLYRNTSKILEQAGSARDLQKQCVANTASAACDSVHRALVRILDYLDGSQFVWRDVPTQPQVLIDPTIARVALLEFDTVNQFPPGYLEHIGSHLREITISPGVTAEQRTLAIQIGHAINNVQVWLDAVHQDAAQLVKMSNSQLASASAVSIFNDLFTNANYAFIGKFDPNTSTVQQGVVQIHYSIQGLATFDVTPCTVTSGQNSCA